MEYFIIYLIIGALVAGFDTWDSRKKLESEGFLIVILAQIIVVLTWPLYFLMGEK